MLPAGEFGRTYIKDTRVVLEEEGIETTLDSIPGMLEILREWKIDLGQGTPERISEAVPAWEED
jgi:hypothetical protein